METRAFRNPDTNPPAGQDNVVTLSPDPIPSTFMVGLVSVRIECARAARDNQVAGQPMEKVMPHQTAYYTWGVCSVYACITHWQKLLHIRDDRFMHVALHKHASLLCF